MSSIHIYFIFKYLHKRDEEIKMICLKESTRESTPKEPNIFQKNHNFRPRILASFAAQVQLTQYAPTKINQQKKSIKNLPPPPPSPLSRTPVD